MPPEIPGAPIENSSSQFLALLGLYPLNRAPGRMRRAELQISHSSQVLMQGERAQKA